MTTPPQCGLSLPCQQASASDPDSHSFVLAITCSDDGTGPTHPNGNAIVGSCPNGLGAGIFGTSTNSAGTAQGIGVMGTTQRGDAGQFQSVSGNGVRAAGGQAAVQAIGGQFGVQASSATMAVQATSAGGTAGSFQNSIAEDLDANNNPALDAGTTGTGSAGVFHIDPAPFDKTDNPSNRAAALEARTVGVGPAAEVHIDNPQSEATVLDARTVGTGNAAVVHISNPQSQVTALNVSTFGVGPAAVFTNGINSNTSSASLIAQTETPDGLAGLFLGNVSVQGTLDATAKSFVIDHPLDLANKYLAHASVESSEQACVYSGNIVLDDEGEAVVNLPAWVEALNEDFRYQLTCVGRSAPVYVADEVAGNQFRIGGGTAGMKVSWQLTGIRKDAWARAHPLVVERDKPERERGYFRHPELFGSDPEHSIARLHVPG